MTHQGKLIIFSAPSGSGKTTIVRQLLEVFPQFEFSISATSRQPRGQEQNGVDYFFLTQDEFRQKVAEEAFVEWEEVYNGTCYGTLKREMQRIWQKGNVIIFDVDVMGGINLNRLVGRATDTPETIEKRVAKADFEISKSAEFDHIVINDRLDEAVAEAKEIINRFLA